MISVVIPCRNEVSHIAQCVDAIFANDVADDVQVIVVDGMSDDGTINEIQKLQQKYPTLELVENTEKITPFAFNLGIKASKGEYVQIIGARQIISSAYLRKAKESLEENPAIWCVGGSVENIYQNEESKRIGLAMGSPFGVGMGNFRVLKESKFVDTVGTPMYPMWVFEKVGYFDETLIRNQDDEFNYRITSAGGKILLNANILIKYYVRSSVNKLFRQYFQYGYWKVFVNKKHKTITTLRQLIPALFVFGLFAGLILTLLWLPFGFVFLAGIFLYVSAALWFGIKAAGNLKDGLMISTVFPILHFGYGWGYLRGILAFLIFGKNPSKKASELTR